ncbi:glycoside hydrolase family 2 [Candidatus Poribacteria bacterium]|nr:glycoside hydrolase family 2 [Candidatus Poribacteria bacterium]
MKASKELASTMVISLDGEWLLATDPQNTGREQKWFTGPVPDAKLTKVPWIIQEAFPGYHGVAWYWRDFVSPANLHLQGRYLLRFWAVDYMADVWLNDVYVGGHEGGETPFVLDVTEFIKPLEHNRLAVRVLNPTNEPIDGIVLNETPHRSKAIPYRAGGIADHGGIEDSVELLIVPVVRVEDLFVRPDPETGIIRIQANIRNAGQKSAEGRLVFTVSPAASGETLNIVNLERELPPGDTLIETNLQVSNPRLWELNDPYLYRVTMQVLIEDSNSFDEYSVRCGFRDFRFEDGYFRLNGRRIFLRCSHTGNHCPIGLWVPHDPDLLRRGLLDARVMGFNAVRFLAGVARRYLLDLCDEIGLMVYEESYAGWCLANSPKMAERFDRATAEMIRRDRNHPSIVIWGLLNETNDGPVFRHAVDTLPLIRSLDATRMVMLNSGRWDKQADIGSLSNPGTMTFQNVLSDQHYYPRVPHTADIIQSLRTFSGGQNNLFLSEYGIGSAVDLVRVTRHYEQLGAELVEDAQFYRNNLNRFMADWEKWRMAETFDRPEDYFMQCLRKMAGQRLLGLNAIRANPNLAGYSLTSTVDPPSTGEGLTTTFRELKPGTIDAMFDGFAPLRWCLFVEPVNVYRGTTIRLEAVLANEDALSPGEYPVRLQVVGPNAMRVFERTITVTIPEQRSQLEPPFAMPVFAENVVIDGPSGKYRFMATFERGAAATGGDVEFYLSDTVEIPTVETEVILWGEDAELTKWLTNHGISVRQFTSTSQVAREVILVSQKPATPGNTEVFREIACRIARGSTAVFLSPEVFKKGDNPVGWVPLENKGSLAVIRSWVYLKDEWAKNHPIFDGLPAGGLMDYTFYREIIPDIVWSGQEPPAEAVAGAINTALGYSSGLLVSVYNLGAGRFFLNTLRLRENLGKHPVFERLLLNMLRYAAPDVNKPLADVPLDFNAQLSAMGYL